MSSLLKRVFDDECSSLPIDAALVKVLNQYMNHLLYKNEEHTRFFGGVLIGVERVKFLPIDRDNWFYDIIKQDEFVITDALKDRAGTVESIKEQWEVSGDTMNLSCVWLLSKLYHSKLTHKLKTEGMIAVLFTLHFKFFTSRLNRHFEYPIDTRVAEAMFRTMSMRFEIKQSGSWLKYFMNRCEGMLDPQWKYREVIRNMDDDREVTLMLNAVQGVIRESLKDIYRVFLDVKDQKLLIHKQGNTVEHDGVETLRDISHGYNSYKTYLISILADQTNFIKAELQQVIEGIMPSMSPKHFETTLVWLSANASLAKAREIRTFAEDVLVHSFNYMNDTDHRIILKNTSDLPGLLVMMRGAYMSSRSADPTLLKLRDHCEKFVKLATGNKNDAVISSVRTGVLLYIVLRTMTKRHYTT